MSMDDAFDECTNALGKLAERIAELEQENERLRIATADDLRKQGWIVAVHKDYRYHGTDFTFWLFTEPGGRWVKGEGRTDTEALNSIRAQLKTLEPVGGE